MVLHFEWYLSRYCTTGIFLRRKPSWISSFCGYSQEFSSLPTPFCCYSLIWVCSIYLVHISGCYIECKLKAKNTNWIFNKKQGRPGNDASLISTLLALNTREVNQFAKYTNWIEFAQGRVHPRKSYISIPLTQRNKTKKKHRTNMIFQWFPTSDRVKDTQDWVK